MAESEVEHAVLKSVGETPLPEEVRDLYAADSTEPPLFETRQPAQVFADLFATALERSDVLAVSARQKARLGEYAPAIDMTLALLLLARAPSVQRRGLGRRALVEWLDAVEHESVWLQMTDLDTPAQRLYRSVDFKAIGHGLEAPNSAPA